jgi:diaminopimelate epimerase
MELAFAKMHGLGNDFVVLDGMRQPIRLDAEQVRRLADRRLGIGCDQVLLLEPGADDTVDARFRIFNADGGEVEQCGNGARCAADFLRRRGYSSGGTVVLEAAGAPLRVHVDGADSYRVDMGVPRFEPEQIPMNAAERRDDYELELAGGELIRVSALSLGNPHAVLRVNDVARAAVAEIGRRVQESGVFPRGVNVGFMQILDPGHIRLRVFERGAGETLACGSGACAAVVAGRLHDSLDADVAVDLPGGRLGIAWAGPDQPVWMTGPAATAFEGRIRL